jgi:hypothetical protein
MSEENINEFLLYKLEKLRTMRSGEEINITFIKTSSDENLISFCDSLFNILNKSSTRTIGIRVINK